MLCSAKKGGKNISQDVGIYVDDRPAVTRESKQVRRLKLELLLVDDFSQVNEWQSEKQDLTQVKHEDMSKSMVG